LRDHTPVALFPREIDYTEWQTLRRYPILNWNMGMTYRLRERDERVYPQGELARRTIGQVGDKGNYGVEYVLLDVLEGRDGKARRQRIARGFYGRVVGGDNSEPEDGLDVVTTLDLEMQDVADRALRRQLEAQNALWGTALVMEVATGDLLAMANLSRTKSGAYAEVKNHALSSRMEPGSTFKLAALLALVDDAGMSLDETFDTGNGARVKVGRTTVQDSHGLPPLNLKDAVAHSSNVFFARAVYETYKDDPERYVDYLRHLHLDRTVGLEEFGAVAPIFPAPGMKIWYPDVSIVNMGYGYAIELTPLHTLALDNAVANDGCMVAPRLVREIRRGGEVVERPERRVLVDKICSSSALRKVRECLEEVGTTGTAKQFFRDTTLFKIAGKTGTAQFAQDGIKYSDGYYLGTMVLYFPADEPKYTVLTAMFTRRGRGTTYYGAGLSGPCRSADRQLHLQPSARVVRPRRRDRRCALRPHGQGGRHRPDPRGGGRTDAPRGERAPFGLGAHARRFARQGDGDAACGRSAYDARRARHGIEGGRFSAGKPRTAGRFHRQGGRARTDVAARRKDTAGANRNIEIEINELYETYRQSDRFDAGRGRLQCGGTGRSLADLRFARGRGGQLLLRRDGDGGRRTPFYSAGRCGGRRCGRLPAVARNAGRRGVLRRGGRHPCGDGRHGGRLLRSSQPRIASGGRHRHQRQDHRRHAALRPLPPAGL